MLKTPFVGIEIEKVQQQWQIQDFTYAKWAEQYNIKRGDIVVEVDNQPIKIDGSTHYQIKGASSIKIQSPQGANQLIEIKYYDFPRDFIYFILLPTIYFIMTLVISIYLQLYKKESFHSLHIFLLFMLTVAVTYGAIGPAGYLGKINILIVSNGAIASILLLLHFLINYLQLLNIRHWVIIKPAYLYSVLIIICLSTLLERVIPALYNWNTIFILAGMSLLIFYGLFMLAITYLKYRQQQLLVLLFFLIGPFLPMLLLYVLPMILFQQQILPIALCTLFLLAIPILLMFTQLPDYLFDINYEISKIRYYSILSLVAASIMAIGLYVILNIQPIDAFEAFFLLFIVLFGMLYLKERIDYANRKVLYSPKGNYVHFVYKTIEQITHMPSVDQLLKRFSEALAQQLNVSDVKVHIYTIGDAKQEMVASSKVIDDLKLGTVKKMRQHYIGCLHETLDKKYIVTIANEGGLYLKKEELLSLELLIMYVSNFIDNTQFVERLIDQLDSSQQSTPAWLQKFIWMQLENEKSQLAQELHDTILQQQLYLIRELDVAQVDMQLIKRHREHLIELNTDLRQYCEQLKPPLLDKQGLHAALNKLFIEVEERAEFTIIHEIEDIALGASELPLLIYRSVQEMLNNALKHAQATYVKITLTAVAQGFELIYFDNGIGCDLAKVNEKSSMGLQGMKERVHAYNGFIELTSAPDEGMRIRIKIEE